MRCHGEVNRGGAPIRGSDTRMATPAPPSTRRSRSSHTVTMTAHTCPYAAALSDDETSQSSSHHRSIRSKCPAFANACPFRDAASDPEKLRDILKTVPTSHFTTTPFQQAMEHIHNVSSWLGSRGTLTGRNTAVEPFIIQGGCPFQSFHKSHHASSSEKQLAVAMEEYSLAAIMGQLGGRLTEKEGREEEGEPEDERQWKQEVSDTVGPLYPDNSAEPRREKIQEIQPSISSSVSTLSQALKSGTAESHTAAENVHFVKNFIKGIIDRELYMELVTGLYHTYVTLEKLLDRHAPTYFPSLHFPQELSRAEALHEDMEFWHGIHWRNKCNPSPAVKDYIDRMEEVGRMDPLLLLSHAYTRYLGDLSGGKVLSRIARRALHLDGYNGLQFYQFESISSYKVFKDQYRSALDELALEPDEVGRLVAEANVGTSNGVKSTHVTVATYILTSFNFSIRIKHESFRRTGCLRRRPWSSST
jgi:heme oxygenase